MQKKTNRYYVKILYGLTQDLHGEKLKSALREFLKLLVKDRKLKKVEPILKDFSVYAKKTAGIHEITITSARHLHAETVKKIKKIFGEKTEAITNTDPELIGGIKIRLEDKIFDATIKTQLNQLKNKLI